MTALPVSRTPDPAEAPPLNWGIIAPGGIAASFVDGVRRYTRQRIVAVASRSPERGQAFAQRWSIDRVHDSYEALVADPTIDAVYVASPHSLHHDHALLAIAAGKHVLVEKSFTRNAVEARAVIDAARAAQVACVEAMWTRFLPSTDIVRQVLADGLLGDIETVIADHGQRFEPDPTSRLFAPELAGGALLDLGIYPVSWASFVLGRPTGIQATGTLTQTGVDRQISLVLTHESPAQALLSTTLAANTPTTSSISGSRGRLELDGPFYAPGVIRWVGPHGETSTSAPPPITGHLGLCHEAAHVATLVVEGAQESPLLPWAETLAIMETLDEIRAQVGVRFPGE